MREAVADIEKTSSVWIPDATYLNKKSFLHFPNIPNKPALVFIVKEGIWKKCKTVKQTKPHFISVQLENGTIYTVPKIRNDFVVPLLDYYDMVEVCRNCRYRRRVSWSDTNTCNWTASEMYFCFHRRYEKVEYVEDECFERQPLYWFQKLHDNKFGKPTDDDILKWKKWDKFLI